MSSPHAIGENIIELRNAVIAQSTHIVLDGINIGIPRGIFCYLIGKTGAGKSSLLKVLYGHLPLRGGHAEIAGFDLEKLRTRDIPALRRRLGIIFQDFQLLTDRSVEKNLEFVLKATGWKDKAERSARIDEVLESVGMISKRYNMPHELSGGEQQRIAIARALLNHPEIILADEPTGNLDPETSNDIMTLLRDICTSRNVAVLMATHDYHLIQNFPGNAIRCEDGGVSVIDTQQLFEE